MEFYKDPFLHAATNNYKKFGDIYCNEQGNFIYCCHFCPNRTKRVNDVEQHLSSHFTDIFQSKNEQIEEITDSEVAEENEYRNHPRKTEDYLQLSFLQYSWKNTKSIHEHTQPLRLT